MIIIYNIENIKGLNTTSVALSTILRYSTLTAYIIANKIIVTGP